MKVWFEDTPKQFIENLIKVMFFDGGYIFITI